MSAHGPKEAVIRCESNSKVGLGPFPRTGGALRARRKSSRERRASQASGIWRAADMHAEPIGRQRYNPAADLQPQQSANNLDRGGRHVENSRRRCRNHDRRRVPVRARRPGRQGGHCRRQQGDGRRRADVNHVFGLGSERKFRPEQDDRRSAGDDDHQQLHARHRSGAACIAGDWRNDAADHSGRPAAAGRNVQSAHHAGQCGLDAAARSG